MRLFKKLIYLLVFAVLAIWFYNEAAPVLTKWLTRPIPETAKFNNSSVALAYPLKKNKWLTFSLPNNSDFVKVTTNAEFLNSPGANIEYALEYEILDDRNKIIYKNKYYIKSKKEIFRKTYSKRILSNPFIINGQYYLAPSQSFMIPMFKEKHLSKIRFKQIPFGDERDHLVAGILLRLYAPKDLVPGKANILWLRLPRSKRKELSSSNFYPLSMLSETEKENLIKNLNSSIAPSDKNISVVRICHVPYKDLHPRKLCKIKIDPTIRKYKNKLYSLYFNSDGGRYKNQSMKNIEEAEKLFIGLFKGETAKQQKTAWKKLGMNITTVKKGKRIFTVVYEPLDKQQGRGLYMFCKSKLIRNIVLEMPHRYFDRYTGYIGFKLFLSGYYTAAAWNTVFRYQTPNYVPFTSDMAHNINSSYFSAFTKAFCNAMPKNSMLIQLHGYNSASKSQKLVKRSKIIASEATNKPSKEFLFYANRLRAKMPNPFYIYPEVKNIQDLAALGNAAATVLEKYSSRKPIFLHIEMNEDVRKEMRNSFKMRETFTDCVKYKMKHMYKQLYSKHKKKHE